MERIQNLVGMSAPLLYIITDYQRRKGDENGRLSLNWNMNREIAKINYRIHTDAIKEHLIVPELPKNTRTLHIQQKWMY